MVYAAVSREIWDNSSSPISEIDVFWMTAYRNIQAVRPGMQVLKLSAKTADGMEEYLNFLRARLDQLRGAVAV